MIIRRIAVLAVVTLLVGACSSGGAADQTGGGPGGELQATRWVLSSYAFAGALAIVPDDQYADAEFTSQRVKGFAGCNTYDAVYRTGGRMLLVSMAATTRVACGETAGAFESAYLDLVQRSRFYNVRADTLTIRGGDGAVLLVFDAAPANLLLGSWLVDSYLANPGAGTVPLAGTELTAVFHLAKVSGAAGCNTFDGPYTTNGNLAAIGPLATTRLACADDVATQETAFLAALKGVGRIESRDETLLLQDLKGGTLVVLSRPSAAEPAQSPTAAPIASVNPSRPPSPAVAPSPSTAPTAKPTAKPTAAPTAPPTPVPSLSPAPTIAPPASVPPEATCTVIAPPNVAVATIVYPAAWSTVAAPSTLACRYFDPKPITVPADPATLVTAVMIKADLTLPYADALAAATNPTAWNVLKNQPVTVSGLPATRIEATSSAGSPGFPPGVTRYGYLIDLGQGSAWFETGGTIGSSAYVANTSVVDVMASESAINSIPTR